MTCSVLSSRDRMLAAMKRQGPDHIPFSPYISQGPYWKEPLLWHNQIDRVERMLDLGLDPTVDIWLPDVCPSPQVEIKTWREEKDGKILVTKEFHTPAGVLRQTVQETEDWCRARHGAWIPTTFGIENRNTFGMELFDDYNVSRRTEPWVKGPQDLEKLKYLIRRPEGYRLDEWRMDARRAMEFARKHNVLTVARRTIVGDAFQWFCDIPWFLMQLADDPKFVQEFFSIFQAWALQEIELALEVGVDVVQYRGWYEIPTYWGPRFFHDFIKPVIENQAGIVHQAGKLFSYLLPEGQGAYAEILKTMDIDILQGIDPRMLHGGDLKQLFNHIGDRASFWGGVNAEVTLESQDAKRIEEEVKTAVDILGSRGGLVLSAFLFPEVPQQGIHYMIDAWRKYACNKGTC